MSEGFIDELRNALDKGTVLSGGDIDARYHHDTAGNPAPKPRAVVPPENDGGCLRAAAALSSRRCPRYDAGQPDRALPRGRARSRLAS